MPKKEKTARRPVNLWLSEKEKEELQIIADANGLSISGLLRFVLPRIKRQPEEFGLLSPNGSHKSVRQQ